MVVPAIGAAVGLAGRMGGRLDQGVGREVVVAVHVGVHAREVSPQADLEEVVIADDPAVVELVEDALVGEHQVVVQVVHEGRG